MVGGGRYMWRKCLARGVGCWAVGAWANGLCDIFVAWDSTFPLGGWGCAGCQVPVCDRENKRFVGQCRITVIV